MEPAVPPTAIPTSSTPTAAQPAPSPASISSGGQRLSLRAADYSFAPRALTAATGPIQVTFVNDGLERHTFNLKNLDYRGELYNSPSIEPGATGILEFQVDQPGDYVFSCILYSHQNKGQEGVLRVTAR
jgi:plastocyanin